jgi:hypothetical protein
MVLPIDLPPEEINEVCCRATLSAPCVELVGPESQGGNGRHTE